MSRRPIAFYILVFLTVLLLDGCIQKTTSETSTTTSESLQSTTTLSRQEPAVNATIHVNQTQPETPGPYGCKTKDECNSYCNRKPFECKAWCKVKKDICNAYSLAVDTESKIPGNPCTQDTDCHEGLICLDYKCDIPTPDKIEQKAEFKLPGNQSTMEECSQYCINPENNLECAGFCKKLPIFCGHSINQDTEETPEEPTPDEQDNPNLETKNQTRSQTLNQTNNEGHGNTLTFYVI